ncbi:MAG: KUP/HAK/KT family potassium transporter [Bacteroidia bacterium]
MGHTHHGASSHSAHHAFSAAGALIALGIIFGDIGTSPLYVFKAIIGKETISQELVYGGMSCVFWTLTLVTTLKYVYLALNADNKGEGGIFALYALVRRFKGKWVAFPAIIGSASLLADGFITPPISISSAVEGLELIESMHWVKPYIIPIILGIVVALFIVQQFGTNAIGRAFGPVMAVWFAMLSILGVMNITAHPEVIWALSPHYAFNLLVNHPGGFWLLGAVFLCTTGAEALYSDLGHCGKENIRVSWTFVKVALILNYLGQAAWLMSHEGQTISKPPFYAMIPESFLPIAVGIATFATIIASQALITGTFTLANEAMKMKFWPRMKVSYPTQLKGQIYIPAMNWILMCGCIAVVLIFKESSKMEAAYGLAITLNMLMTTSLLTRYLFIKHYNKSFIYSFVTLFILIEGAFFFSNIIKFKEGGWFTVAIAAALFLIMYVLYHARILKGKYTQFDDLHKVRDLIKDLSNDYSIPREATNLVYLCVANDSHQIDKSIVYSITRKRPKRADIYWFLHVEVSDDPYKKEYSVDTLIPEKMFFVSLIFGFKVQHKVNALFRKVVDEMIQAGEIDKESHYPSLRKHHIPADFKFILLNTRVSVDQEVSPFNQFIIRAYRVIKKYSLSQEEEFGLESTNVEVERIPITLALPQQVSLPRGEHDGVNTPLKRVSYEKRANPLDEEELLEE